MSGLLDLLEEVKDDLGERDVRETRGRNIIEEIETVLAEVKMFDDENNGSKSHGVLNIGIKKTKELEKMISALWNTSLGPESSVKESNPSGDWVFHKPSPLKNKTEYKCPADGCGSVYTNGMAFRRHLRAKNHGDPKEVVIPLVTCRMPHNKGTRAKEKHTMDQIGAHLYNVSLLEF